MHISYISVGFYFLFAQIFVIKALVSNYSENAIVGKNVVRGKGVYKTMDSKVSLKNPYKYYVKMLTQKTKLPNGTIIEEKVAGAVMDSGAILTNVFVDPEEKKKAFEKANIPITSEGDILKAESLYNWQKKVGETREGEPDFSGLLSSGEGTQITVVQPKRKNPHGIGLPIAKGLPEPGMECIIPTFGKLNNSSKTIPLYPRPIKVKIMSKSYCEEELCEYEDPICVTSVDPHIPISSLMNGGEPLICDDEISGIVRGSDVKGPAIPLASTSENRKWITEKAKQLKAIENVEEEVKEAACPIYAIKAALFNSLLALLTILM